MGTQLPAPLVTEKAFQRVVEQAFRVRGWMVYHTWASLHSAGGFPDVVAVKGHLLVFAELKSERGKLTDEQRHWYDALLGIEATTGRRVRAFVWRPSDWPAIEALLDEGDGWLRA